MNRRLGVGAIAGVLLLTGCGVQGDAEDGQQEPALPPAVQEAAQVMKVTSPHEATGGTLLEGPVFAESGKLYVVDVMAPAGEPKVLTVDLENADAKSVYTDESSAFTSAQFDPTGERLYLTDIASGSVVSMVPDGSDLQTVFAGEVGGTRMLPDDLTFDEDGAMFVTDTTGMQGPGWEAPGRVVRVGADGAASVLADRLPSPNGIAFDETGNGLWVAQYNASRIDYYALNADHTSVQAAYPGVHVSAGRGRVDSTAVDAAGNIYQAFHGLAQVNVYSAGGELRQTIRVPGEGLESATNVAIRPGTTEGVITVSGPSGGYLYSFDALAEGTRNTNGG